LAGENIRNPLRVTPWRARKECEEAAEPYPRPYPHEHTTHIIPQLNPIPESSTLPPPCSTRTATRVPLAPGTHPPSASRLPRLAMRRPRYTSPTPTCLPGRAPRGAVRGEGPQLHLQPRGVFKFEPKYRLIRVCSSCLASHVESSNWLVSCKMN
jgi:hypothetical protein